MKGHVDVLLKKFLCIPDTKPPTVEASGADDGGNDVDDELPVTGSGGGNDHGGDDPST
jgi:hypothetical protein